MADDDLDDRLTTLLEDLDAAIDEVADVPVSSRSGEQGRAWAERLSRSRSRLDAVVCRAVAETDWVDTGLVTRTGQVATVVAADRSCDRRSAAADVNLGRWVGGHPALADAWSAGRIGRDHVQAIRRCENPRTALHLGDAVDYLIEAAVSCSWPEFQAVLRAWTLTFDPDGEEPAEQVGQRYCRMTRRHDGTWEGRFRLDPLTGQAVAQAIGRHEQRLWRDDEEDPTSTRTAANRRADALAELIMAGHGATPGSGPAPLVHVVLSERVAADLLSRAPGDRSPLPLDPRDIDGRCETVDGHPLHPHQVLGLLALGTLQRLVLSAEGQITDLGRSVRTFPTHLRNALLARDRGRCQRTGCDAPLPWLQADHVVPWVRDGWTSLTNGQILCDPHNKQKRDGPS